MLQQKNTIGFLIKGENICARIMTSVSACIMAQTATAQSALDKQVISHDVEMMTPI